MPNCSTDFRQFCKWLRSINEDSNTAPSSLALLLRKWYRLAALSTWQKTIYNLEIGKGIQQFIGHVAQYRLSEILEIASIYTGRFEPSSVIFGAIIRQMVSTCSPVYQVQKTVYNLKIGEGIQQVIASSPMNLMLDANERRQTRLVQLVSLVSRLFQTIKVSIYYSSY